MSFHHISSISSPRTSIFLTTNLSRKNIVRNRRSQSTEAREAPVIPSSISRPQLIFAMRSMYFTQISWGCSAGIFGGDLGYLKKWNIHSKIFAKYIWNFDEAKNRGNRITENPSQMRSMGLQYLEYLPTFTRTKWPSDVDKYSSAMENLGLTSKGEKTKWQDAGMMSINNPAGWTHMDSS